VWYYWDHFGEQIKNLGNMLVMCLEHGENPLGIIWEHIGNIKNPKAFYPFPKEK
jgi:hypothetical protein